jgi:hypothetical protein
MKGKTLSLFLVAVFALAGIMSTGCVPHRMAAVVAAPTCSAALSQGISGYSDYELAEVLNDSDTGGSLEDCWIPVMKQALDANRAIPYPHLVKAVKVFNKKRHEAYFHKAVQRYLAEIARGGGSYRPEDRQLLETYTRYVIHNAYSSSDPNLAQAKIYCHKLDQALYNKFFN